MIRVSKRPKKYAVMVKVSKEASKNPIFMKGVKADNILKPRPKNAFKIVRLKTITGFDSDDYINNLLSVRAEFLVYTFKRR